MPGPVKKHAYSSTRGTGWLNLDGTLCGFPDPDKKLVVKDNKDVTCLVCLRILKGEPRYKRNKILRGE